ncbi:MAG: hypothetical protein J7K84_01550, partial [Deltaproteobacteria bacterium]|nr:hypothetical protein [Deltaproteobacteria bacterium]
LYRWYMSGIVKDNLSGFLNAIRLKITNTFGLEGNTPSLQDLKKGVYLSFIPVVKTTGYTTFPLQGSLR